MTSQILAAVSAIGLLGAGVAASGETRAFQAIPTMSSFADGEGAGAGECRIQILRTGTPGASTLTRDAVSAADGGGCVCTLTIGAVGANATDDAAATALQQAKDCVGAPSSTYTMNGTSPVPFVLGAFTVVGTVAAVAGNSNAS